MSVALAAADEQRHQPEDHPGWGEAWSFDFVTPDASLGGFVRLGLLPARKTCWYWACVVGPGRDPVVVVDHEVPFPRSGLEIRTEGLWADHIIEDPFDHVSVGCEAFALRLDEADAAAAGDGRPLLGERVPFGLDVGWETAGPLVERPNGYALPCSVVGEAIVGHETIPIDVAGWRAHSWGIEDWWSPARPSMRGRFLDGTWIDDDANMLVEPVVDAPILALPGDGRIDLLSRALCRVIDPASGRTGVAWTESHLRAR